MERIPELCHEQGGVFVVEVEDDLGDTLVGPGAVDEKQLPQVAELGDGDVGGPGSLESFNTRDTNADVSSLDHGDIVGTVADCEQNRL